MKAKGKVCTKVHTTCSQYSCGTGVLLPVPVLECSYTENSEFAADDCDFSMPPESSGLLAFLHAAGIPNFSALAARS